MEKSSVVDELLVTVALALEIVSVVGSPHTDKATNTSTAPKPALIDNRDNLPRNIIGLLCQRTEQRWAPRYGGLQLDLREAWHQRALPGVEPHGHRRRLLEPWP